MHFVAILPLHNYSFKHSLALLALRSEQENEKLSFLSQTNTHTSVQNARKCRWGHVLVYPLSICGAPTPTPPPTITGSKVALLKLFSNTEVLPRRCPTTPNNRARPEVVVEQQEQQRCQFSSSWALREIFRLNIYQAAATILLYYSGLSSMPPSPLLLPPTTTSWKCRHGVFK